MVRVYFCFTGLALKLPDMITSPDRKKYELNYMMSLKTTERKIAGKIRSDFFILFFSRQYNDEPENIFIFYLITIIRFFASSAGEITGIEKP